MIENFTVVGDYFGRGYNSYKLVAFDSRIWDKNSLGIHFSHFLTDCLDIIKIFRSRYINRATSQRHLQRTFSWQNKCFLQDWINRQERKRVLLDKAYEVGYIEEIPNLALNITKLIFKLREILLLVYTCYCLLGWSQ